jgi:hypothetical protein
MRRGASTVLIVLAAVALLVIPATAAAKKKHRKPKSPPVTVVSATKSTSADGELVTITPTCPPGQLAVGGGFIAPLLISGTTLTDLHIVYESRRVGDNAWQVSAAREHGGGPAPQLSITASADCRSATLTQKKSKKAVSGKKRKKRRKPLLITEVSATGSAATASGKQSTATASCPAGTLAIGGGYSSAPAPNLTASSSFPVMWQSYRSSPTSWLSTFTNSGATAHTMTSYAYCAAGLNVQEASASASLPASSMAGIQSTTLPSPSCSNGRALLGGGFTSTPPTSMGPLPILSKSAAAGPAWEFGVYNLSGAPDSVSSVGYCA